LSYILIYNDVIAITIQIYFVYEEKTNLLINKTKGWKKKFYVDENALKTWNKPVNLYESINQSRIKGSILTILK
jgi:hypothetical protein